MRILILTLLFGLLPGCQDATDPLRVGSNRWPGYAPYYLADEHGELARAQIKLVEYPHATGVMRAFENGSLDAAFMTLDEALRLAAEGLDLQLLLVADVSAGADVLYAMPQIHSLQDLAGQRIGVENTALGGYFLSRILDMAGLRESQVSIVSLPVNEHAQALQRGQIDAVISFASEENAMLSSGARRLIDSRQLPNAIIDVLVLDRQQASAANQQRLREQWYQGLGRWRSEPQPSAEILSRRLGISLDDLQLSASQLQMGDVQLNQRLREDGTLQTQMQRMETYLLERGLILRRPEHSLLSSCRGEQC